MADEIENIEQQIDETKASLLGKLEALEAQVADVVQSTSESVSETVGAVKETVATVKEKVQDAGEYLNLRRQAEKNPWTVFGSSVLAGCVAGYMLGGARHSRANDVRQASSEARESEQPSRTVTQKVRTDAPEEPSQEKHGWFREQLGNLSGLAIAALMGVVRDLAESKLPDGLGKSVSQEVDRFTTSLGAKPIAGPILPQLDEWLGLKEKPAEVPPPRPAATTPVRPSVRPPKQTAV